MDKEKRTKHQWQMFDYLCASWFSLDEVWPWLWGPGLGLV